MTKRSVFIAVLLLLGSLVSCALFLGQGGLTPALAWPLSVAALLALVLVLVAYNASVIPRLHRALAAYSQGDEAAVRAELAAIERSPWRSVAKPSLRYVEALLAFRAGDLALTRRELDLMLAASPGWLLRPTIFVLRASARGLRSLVAALQEDSAQAEADIAAVEGDLDGLPEAPAMAALARAVLLLRAGRHKELHRHLDRHRSLLLGALGSRTRVLARALLRPWIMPGHDAYRSAADEGELPSDPGTAWLVRLAPSLAPLLARRPIESEAGAPGAPRPAAPAPAAPRIEAPPPGQASKKAGLRVVAVWAALVVMFVALWQFLAPAPGPRHEAVQRESPQPSLLTSGPAALLAVPLFMGLVAFVLHRQRRWQQRSNQADRALLSGDFEAATTFYRELLGQASPASRAVAAGKLAGVALVYGDPEDALRWTTLGLAEARSLSGSVQLAYTGPLLAEESVAQALLGRASEARATVARLAKELPDSMQLPSTRFACELINLTHAGDLPAARALASSQPETLLLRIETELLAELTRATGAPEPREPTTSLLREAASEPHLTAWLERAAPSLMTEARAIARG